MPTKTLVPDDTGNNCRIDSQPATVMYRNIHFQCGNNSYAVCTIDEGGRLCEFGYKKRLLKYVKEGLYLSYKSKQAKFHIKVEVKEKEPKKQPKVVKPIIANEVLRKGLAKTIVAKYLQRVKSKAAKGTEETFKVIKNATKIAQKTDAAEHIAIAVEKRLEKEAVEEAEHVLLKKIPIVSAICGFIFAAPRFAKGDYSGAAMEVASGVAGDVPGAGTEASLAIDAALLAKDVEAAVSEANELSAAEIAELKEENSLLKDGILQYLPPPSAIFGVRNSGQAFDESDIGLFGGNGKIRRIQVRCGDLIDGIQIEYENGISGKYHGGNGGGLQVMELRPQENIIRVSGKTLDNGLLASITFETDYGATKTLGPEWQNLQNDFTYEMFDGSYLVAIKGYDLFPGNKKSFPGWAGTFELLPGIGFVAKCLVPSRE